MKTNELRQLFLDYFSKNGHKIIESAPLVPIDDPSLLWINAGITPLKKYFDGSVVPDNKRLVSSQKCVRTNDIENVGVTARHQTFFEMLGNFSVGDYFKKQAISFAYEFLTGSEWLNFDPDKLYFTYYPSDVECLEIWKEIGVAEDHLVPLEGNYWEIGEGPCGPCSEIFYDRGESFDSRGIEILHEDLDNDRYVEIWNIVFSQFNGSKDLARENYPELPNKNIDTGMGLERVASIIQDVPTNFDIDIFQIIIKEIEKLSNTNYDGQTAFKIIADHVRTACLAIADSALPSNEGRGYVLRRLLRRAIRYGVKIGFSEPFLYKLVVKVNESLPPYNFENQVSMIQTVIKNEEQKFFNTLESGEKKLSEFISSGFLSGENAFLLYDTFGFPIELTKEIANEKNISVDLDAFNELLNQQKNRSRSSRNEDAGLKKQSEVLFNVPTNSTFVGYNILQCISKVIAVIKDDDFVEIGSGEIGLVFDKTPFYAESGGQISDTGTINNIRINEVFKAPHGQHIHYISTDSEIKVGDDCVCKVDIEFRNNITINHSSTHLLNYALKSVLGQHIKQQGSYVCDQYLRFDFAHYDSVSESDIVEIENTVNKYLDEFSEITIDTMSIDEAKNLGASALFGEKYGDIVRVVKLGESLELCGGCHINSFDLIKRFGIISYESKGSGVYRIVASTNDNIKSILKDDTNILVNDIQQIIEKTKKIANNKDLEKLESDFTSLTANLDGYNAKISLNTIKEKLTEIKKTAEKQVKEHSTSKALGLIDFANDIQDICDLKTVIVKNDELSVDQSKAVIDDQFEKHKLDIMVLVNTTNNVVFIAKASDVAIEKGIKCGDLVKQAAIICGGNGGGRPNFAQAGGKNLEKIDDAMNKLTELIKSIC